MSIALLNAQQTAVEALTERNADLLERVAP